MSVWIHFSSSALAFLKLASQKQPLVLVLDDLHWADQPSLLLLQFLARELSGGRLLVMGTYSLTDDRVGEFTPPVHEFSHGAGI